jgi:tRNA modification GTPase
MFTDTIAAIATPIGEGGIAVIRVSGPKALTVADKCFAPSGKSSAKPSAAATHTLHYGHIIHAGAAVDEVMLAVLRAPRTFTREDTVEISCHGGLLTTKLVLDAVLTSGARLAEPGEFTRRAFLNGRIDLVQAEAVADLIHARTELALQAANEQLAGKLSVRINLLRDDLMRVLAHVEAHIDFPDEDISPDTQDELLRKLDGGVAFIDALLRTANEGQILRRGLRAAIIGRPNAGKSSLLNLLLGHDRAIVSPIAGTTRDTIEETANIRGIPVVFVDTAGLREAGDVIEQEGIRRSLESAARADLVLHLIDASEPLTDADAGWLKEFAGKKRIIVRNKVDLPVRLEIPLQSSMFDVRCSMLSADEGGKHPTSNIQHPTSKEPTPDPSQEGSWQQDEERPPSLRGFPSWEGSGVGLPLVDVSCTTSLGLEALKDAIKSAVWSGDISGEMFQVMINSRHQEALQRARTAALRAAEALRSGLTLELVAADVRASVQAVGEIVGKTSTEDLLDSIFSQFCLGK